MKSFILDHIAALPGFASLIPVPPEKIRIILAGIVVTALSEQTTANGTFTAGVGSLSG
jgi:hypothetical protein